AKSIPVWAIGMYPVGLEDNEIEIVLYVPRNRDERDHDSQAMFRRDKYYFVGGKIVLNRYAGCVKPKMSVATSTHLTIAGRALESNKCPLKVSLIGSAQGNPTVIDTDNSNITKNLKEIPVIQTPTLNASSDVESVPSVKCKRSEETSELIDIDFINNNDDYKSETNEASSIKADQEETEDLVKKNKSQKKSTCTQIKERPIRTTRSPKKSYHMTVEDDKSDKE
ncbi:15802_t:CDS:2, partial [Gigaspora rosea]